MNTEPESETPVHRFIPKLITASPGSVTMVCRRCGEWWDHPNHRIVERFRVRGNLSR